MSQHPPLDVHDLTFFWFDLHTPIPTTTTTTTTTTSPLRSHWNTGPQTITIRGSC